MLFFFGYRRKFGSVWLIFVNTFEGTSILCMTERDLLRANVLKRIQPSEDGLLYFAGLGKVQHYRKRDKLLVQGEVARFEAFIVSGCVRMYHTDARQHEHNMQFGFEDWRVCDLVSLYSGTPAHHSIEALEETTAILFSHADIDNVLTRYPEFERYFRLLMQAAYVAGQERMIGALSQSAEQRYLELINRFPLLESRVAQHHIASYIGISPEALSRIKRAMIIRERTPLKS
jgi:CRP-like cAMP-binding protein